MSSGVLQFSQTCLVTVIIQNLLVHTERNLDLVSSVKKESTFISYSNCTIIEIKRVFHFGNTLYIQQMSSKDICLEFPLPQMNFLNSFHKTITSFTTSLKPVIQHS